MAGGRDGLGEGKGWRLSHTTSHTSSIVESHTNEGKGTCPNCSIRTQPGPPGASNRKVRICQDRHIFTSWHNLAMFCQNKEAPNQTGLEVSWGRNTDQGTSEGWSLIPVFSPTSLQACGGQRSCLMCSSDPQHRPQSLDVVSTQQALAG